MASIVLMDRDLELHEARMKTMKSSLKKFEKKLHSVELFMHKQPAQYKDNKEREEVQSEFNKLLNCDHFIEFPTLHKINKDYKKRNPDPVTLSTGEVVRNDHEEYQDLHNSKLKTSTIPAKSLEKLRKSRESKVFGKSNGLGKKPEGEVLGTIKGYTGKNGDNSPNRILTRKFITRSALDVVTSTPSWIGPDYYTDGVVPMTSINDTKRPSTHYQVPFRSIEREEFPTYLPEYTNKKNCTVTKQQLAYIENYPPPTDSPHYRLHTASSSCRPSSADYNQEMGSFTGTTSVWSRSSPGSTLGSPTALSGKMSPRNIRIGPLSPSSGSGFASTWGGMATSHESITESVLWEPDGVSASTSYNPLSIKLTQHESSRYKNRIPDYTMNALSLRETVGPEMKDVRIRPEVANLLQRLASPIDNDEDNIGSPEDGSKTTASVRYSINSNMSLRASRNDMSRRSGMFEIQVEGANGQQSQQQQQQKRGSLFSGVCYRANPIDNVNDNDQATTAATTTATDVSVPTTNSNAAFTTLSDKTDTFQHFDPAKYVNYARARSQLGTPSSRSLRSPITRAVTASSGSSSSRRKGKNSVSQIDPFLVDIEGLLLPGEGVDLDGAASLYSPSITPLVSARDKSNEDDSDDDDIDREEVLRKEEEEWHKQLL